MRESLLASEAGELKAGVERLRLRAMSNNRGAELSPEFNGTKTLCVFKIWFANWDAARKTRRAKELAKLVARNPRSLWREAKWDLIQYQLTACNLSLAYCSDTIRHHVWQADDPRSQPCWVVVFILQKSAQCGTRSLAERRQSAHILHRTAVRRAIRR